MDGYRTPIFRPHQLTVVLPDADGKGVGRRRNDLHFFLFSLTNFYYNLLHIYANELIVSTPATSVTTSCTRKRLVSMKTYRFCHRFPIKICLRDTKFIGNQSHTHSGISWRRWAHEFTNGVNYTVLLSDEKNPRLGSLGLNFFFQQREIFFFQ